MSERKIRETLDKDSVFYNEIETDNSVCSNCYRKVKTVLTVDEWASSRLPDSTKNSLADRTYFEEHTEKANPPTRNKSHYFAHSCKCGSVHGEAKIRPLNKRKTMEYAENIVSRLEDVDVDFSPSAFLEEVRWRKQDPEYQFNEELIFEEALEEAING